MWSRVCCLLVMCMTVRLYGQGTGDEHDRMLREILQRLDALEKQNQELLAEVKALKAERVATAAPPVEERVAVTEARIHEQAQTKVESAQKFPVTLSGMFLMNAFLNNQNAANALGQYGLLNGPGESGATLRQTLLGVQFHGPKLPGGGQVEGDLQMDFWAGPPTPSANWLRIRRAGVALEWGDRTIFFGQDKPLISPYEPNSYAEVGVSPMAGAGNLWFWLPQARFEQQIRLGARNRITLQAAALQAGSPAGTFAGGARPAYEGRLAFRSNVNDEAKFEIGAGFHYGYGHVAGAREIGTHLGSVDWFYRPLTKLEIKGTGYVGGNAAELGGLGNAFYMTAQGLSRAVDSRGAWTQASVPLNQRFTLNLMSGLENDAAAGLSSSALAHSSSVAGNVVLHLTGNVLLSLEAQRLWTRTFQGVSERYNHYDLAVAYLF